MALHLCGEEKCAARQRDEAKQNRAGHGFALVWGTLSHPPPTTCSNTKTKRKIKKRKEQNTTMKKTNRKNNNKNNKRKKQLHRRILITIIIIALILAAFLLFKTVFGPSKSVKLEEIKTPSWIDTQMIDIDGISRNGKKMSKVKDIVVHYVGNPGSTAQQNRDFYESSQSNVSSHFVVGLKGEIIQCIPLNEMSAASNWRNNDTISIEVCHSDDSGKFNKKTKKSLVKLIAWLENQCNLTEKHVIRHYDITGKECPRYYVRNPKQWNKLKNRIKEYRLNE